MTSSPRGQQASRQAAGQGMQANGRQAAWAQDKKPASSGRGTMNASAAQSRRREKHDWVGGDGRSAQCNKQQANEHSKTANSCQQTTDCLQLFSETD